MTIRTIAGTVPPRVAKILNGADRLTTAERLVLAKLLLESVLAGEPGDEADWSAMSLDSFQRDWDNTEDAIYDNWRERYAEKSIAAVVSYATVDEPGVDLDRLRELLFGQLKAPQ